MKITMEMYFDNIADAYAALGRMMPGANVECVVTPATETVLVAEPPAAVEPKVRKPRAAKITEPAAPATEAPTQAPLTAETPVVAPVAAAPETAPVEPSSAASSSPAPVETPQDAAPDNAAAQAAIEAVFAAKGFQGAHQLLAQFGVQRLRELDAAKYGELIEYANKMLAK